jgi:hypothetical protein
MMLMFGGKQGFQNVRSYLDSAAAASKKDEPGHGFGNSSNFPLQHNQGSNVPTANMDLSGLGLGQG